MMQWRGRAYAWLGGQVCTIITSGLVGIPWTLSDMWLARAFWGSPLKGFKDLLDLRKWHWLHWWPSKLMIAKFMEKINTCNVLFRGGGKKNLMFFFPPETCYEVVTSIWLFLPGGTVGYQAQPRLIRPSVRLSVRPSVCLSVCLYGPAD
jgi:hypothetical protein